MDFFNYKNGELYCESVPAEKIARDRVLQGLAIADIPNTREDKAVGDIGVAAAAFQVVLRRAG